MLIPNNRTVAKADRYYQQIAIHRTVEAILKGRQRILITMASGTGKTVVAFQICWKLWNARWNRTGEHRRPKILYLADRNILVDRQKDGIFVAFGDARGHLSRGQPACVRVLRPRRFVSPVQLQFVVRPSVCAGEVARDSACLVRSGRRDNSTRLERWAQTILASRVGGKLLTENR